ncbi:hypothetical protein Tco_0918019, partial [Tanacetum coccineum]
MNDPGYDDDELLNVGKRINDLNSDGSTHETVHLSCLVTVNGDSLDCDFDDDIDGVKKKMEELCSSLENLMEEDEFYSPRATKPRAASHGVRKSQSGKPDFRHHPTMVHASRASVYVAGDTSAYQRSTVFGDDVASLVADLLVYTELFEKNPQLDVKGCQDVYASFDKYVKVERLEGDNRYHAETHGLQ